MSPQSAELLLAQTAASAGAPSDRAQSMLDTLRCLVPFDSAWLAVTDPRGHGYHSLASVDLDDTTQEFLSGPTMARDIEITGTDRARPPLSPSDLPYPAEELQTWADCLMPAGIHEAMATALFSPEGRHVGFLALLSGSEQPPDPTVRRELERLTPVLAYGADPMRTVVAAARMSAGRAVAGAVVHDDGNCAPLPGLPEHALLVPGSPVVAAVRSQIDGRCLATSFGWPIGGRHAPDGHLRVSVLPVPDDAPAGLCAVVVLSPLVDTRGLTARELEVLGLLVEGCSNSEIAETLVVAPRTVAAHMEHVLAKLESPTRTLAAVRAERNGLFVPASYVRGPTAGDAPPAR